MAGLKVLFVVGPMVVGGAERQAVALARQLRDRYCSHVEFWAIYGDGGPLADYLDDNRIPWRIEHAPVIGASAPWHYRLRQVKLLFRFLQRMRAAEFDVVLPFMTLPNTVTSLVWRLSKARLCIWNQRTDGADAFELNVSQSARLAAKLASLCIANNEAGCDYLERQLGIVRDNIYLVHNGISLASSEQSRAEWKAAMEVDETALVVTMVANLHPPKDHATLLRAWRIVMERLEGRGRSLVLALAGRPVSTHQSLRELASQLGIASSVRFLGPVRDIGGLLRASDLSAFASLREGMPNGVLESMAAGLPVVATDLPGIREALGENCERFVTPRKDPDALAARIVMFLEDDLLRAEVGLSNRMRIEKDFSEERMASGFAAIISNHIQR